MKCIFKISLCAFKGKVNNGNDLTFINLDYVSDIDIVPQNGMSLVFILEEYDGDESEFSTDFSSSFQVDSCTLLVNSSELIVEISNSDTRQVYPMKRAKELARIYERQCGFLSQ